MNDYIFIFYFIHFIASHVLSLVLPHYVQQLVRGVGQLGGHASGELLIFGSFHARWLRLFAEQHADLGEGSLELVGHGAVDQEVG